MRARPDSALSVTTHPREDWGGAAVTEAGRAGPAAPHQVERPLGRLSRARLESSPKWGHERLDLARSKSKALTRTLGRPPRLQVAAQPGCCVGSVLTTDPVCTRWRAQLARRVGRPGRWVRIIPTNTLTDSYKTNPTTHTHTHTHTYQSAQPCTLYSVPGQFPT